MELLPLRSNAPASISLASSSVPDSSTSRERWGSDCLREPSERIWAGRRANPWSRECRDASSSWLNWPVYGHQRDKLDAGLSLSRNQASTGGNQAGDEQLNSRGSSSSTSKEHDTPSNGTVIPHAYHSMLAGAAAGLTSSVVTCPLDVVKTRLQAQVSKKGAADYEGVKETITRIWRSAGIRGLYRGLGPTVLGYLPTWGIYFSVYDQIKNSLTPEGKISILVCTPNFQADPLSMTGSDGKDHWGVHIVAAMTAGATGTIVTNPLWLIRTRFMVSLPIHCILVSKLTPICRLKPHQSMRPKGIQIHGSPSAPYTKQKDGEPSIGDWPPA
jgi:hypothetical protein